MNPIIRLNLDSLDSEIRVLPIRYKCDEPSKLPLKVIKITSKSKQPFRSVLQSFTSLVQLRHILNVSSH